MPKTIFGTTEKSNFILNMSDKALQKFAFIVIFIAVLLPQLGNFFITVFDGSSSFLGTFLYAAGFSSLLVFIVTALKKEISFKENKVIFVVAFLAVWTIVSYYGVLLRISDYPENVANDFLRVVILGELGRYEGMISIFAYLGIFLAALCVNREKTVKTVLDTIVGIGAFHGIIAVLQHIPNLDFLTEYADLPTLALEDVMLSSGLCDSPIFYCSFATMILAIAVFGAIYDSSKIRAILYSLTGVLMFTTMLFTSSIVAFVGGGAVLLTAGIIILSTSKTSVKEKCKFLGLALTLVAVLLTVNFSQGIFIRDREIAHFDSFFRLYITASNSPITEEGLYKNGFDRSLDAISQFPLTGTGPDCFGKNQMLHEEMRTDMLDKSYNEFLYIAATRGIPSLIGYLAFLFFVFKNSGRRFKQFFADKDKNYIYISIFVAVTAYIIASFFSASTVTVAPIFWLLCGFYCTKNVG